jgi:hypothetical protein
MAITSYQNFQMNFGSTFLGWLTHRDRGNLARVDSAWNRIIKSYDVEGYKELKLSMSGGNVTLYVRDDQGQHPEMLLGVLGAGGTKKAMKLSNGRALVLPNLDYEQVEKIESWWKRVVHEEVAMSKLLTTIGLLSPSPKKVGVALSSQATAKVIPAYISEDFQEMARTKGRFIIDWNNQQVSTWVVGRDFLFNSEEARFKEENWDAVLGSLLTDIVQISIYDIPAWNASMNFAVVKKNGPVSGLPSEYEVRYFGFDFSDKRKAIENKKTPAVFNDKKAKDVLLHAVDRIFTCEFGSAFHCGPQSKNIKSFYNRLMEKYLIEIQKRSQPNISGEQ